MRALILVDIQNDFCPGGALAVGDGDAVVPIANLLISRCATVLATQDWHPPDHGSFAVNHPGCKPFDMGKLAGSPQVLWPVHCVQGTPGAAFHPALASGRITAIFPKGCDPTIDSYSGFFDNDQVHATGLQDWLRARGFDELHILGLATDYCVKATALDALRLGFRTTVISDGCRSVDLQAGDGERALQAIVQAGGVIRSSSEVFSALARS